MTQDPRFPPPPPPPPPPFQEGKWQPTQQPQSHKLPYAPGTSTKRVPSGIVAILLGSLGIHKFMLGYNTAGLIMLLVSVLTCGFGAAVMGVIGLVEGIIYLTKTDEQFYVEYELQQKPWF